METWALCRELSLLEVEEEVLYRPFSTLSQGEQTKVLLALMFLMEGRFLLVDEPTNHLDLHGREVVSRYLSRKHGFILVSHDRSFLDSCVDHVLSLNRTGLEVQQGNFSSWWKNKEYRDQFEQGEQDRLRKEYWPPDPRRRPHRWMVPSDRGQPYRPRPGRPRVYRP